MKQNTTQSWQTTLATALQQDPKKTGVLGFLALLLLVVSLRAFTGGSHPSMAVGMPMTGGLGGATPVAIPSSGVKPGVAAASLRGWLSTPVPAVTRNDFLVKSEYFPADTTKTSTAAPQSPFWTALEKSLSVQADQKEKREAAVAQLKQAAAAIRPTSTMMGATPRAMINGVLVGEGDTVASFIVLRIESRGIVVERDGVQLAIPME